MQVLEGRIDDHLARNKVAQQDMDVRECQQ